MGQEQKNTHGYRPAPAIIMTEEDLRKYETGFYRLADALPHMVWTAPPNGENDYYNQRWFHFTGFSRSETFQHEWWIRLVHPDDRARTLEAWHHAVAHPGPYEVEYRLWEHTTDQYRWFLARATPIYNPQGNVIKWFGTCTNIDDRKQAEEKLKQVAQELQESEQQLQAAIDVAGLGHWHFDPGTNLFDCSARSKAYLGFPPDATVSLNEIKARLRPPEEGPSLLEALKKQEIFERECQIQWPDGSLHWLAVSGRGRYDKHGQPIGMMGVTLDITARKLGEQRKDTFIGMAGHELKTPLTTIKGFTQLLKRQVKRFNLPEQMVVTLTKLENQANALTKLVNELLDVSKMQAGQLEYTWGKVEIDQLIKDVVETVQPTSPQHSLHIRGTTGRTLIGDYSRLTQVFINLLTNAIKYSPQADRVEILPTCTEQHVEIRVRDYGQGIPPEEQKHIFERFYRIDRGQKQKTEGLGMGLYVAAQIVEKHGGQITVESNEGEGATFCVRLPFSHPHENTPQRE